jgi:hypothetical protein
VKERALLNPFCIEQGTLLGARFHPNAVQVLKPNLETIDDLSRLRELLLAAPYAESLEAFMQSVYESMHSCVT